MPDIGHGTTLGILNGTVYNDIGKITSLAGPSFSADAVDVTNMDSTGQVREFIAGLKDWGEVTFSTVADIDSSGDTTNYYSSVITEAKATTTSNWKVTFPNSVNFTFSALVTGFNIPANTGDAISTDVTLKITGDITWSDT